MTKGEAWPCLSLPVFIFHLLAIPARSYEGHQTTRSSLLREERITHLHFFLHDTASGDGSTVVMVAKPDGAARPYSFGSVFVMDDLLKEGVDPSSRIVGKAQGLYVFSGQDDFSFVMVADFAFTSGLLNGSSISIASRNPVTRASREMAVVGGTGQFRLARGFAHLTTRSFKVPNAVVEYNVTVLHYGADQLDMISTDLGFS